MPSTDYITILNSFPSDMCEYPGCLAESDLCLRVEAPNAVKCLCHGFPAIVDTFTCREHMALVDFVNGGFKDA